MRIIIGLLISACCFGQSKQNIVQTGTVIPPQAMFASVPSSPATGAEWTFTDAIAAGTCTGGGSALAKCRWSGSAWQAVGGAGGGSIPSTTSALRGNGAGGAGAVTGSGSNCVYVDGTSGPCTTGTGTAGGSTGQMQVNSSGALAGQSSTLSGGGSSVFQRATECATGTVSLSGGTWTYPGGTTASTATASQEITIITGLNGNIRYTRVLASEHTIFSSSTVTITKVSIGRAGSSTNDEMLPQTSFMVSSGDAWFAEDRPQTPILGASNTYSVVMAIRTTGGNVSALTAGAINYEVCSYASQ